MSCKHLIWNCYCKEKQEFCNRNLFPRLCDKYERENEVTDMKKIFNKGPAVDISVNSSCATIKSYPFMTEWKDGVCTSTAANDYVSMLELFINKLYPEDHYGYFGLDVRQAEDKTELIMLSFGYDQDHVNKAFVDTVNNFKTGETSVLLALDTFVNRMLRQKHKDYPKKEYPFEFRFVLTLILGYLNKLDSVAIINCDNPEIYFLGKISNIKTPEITKALDQTRRYVEESNALVLAEGMRKVEAWFDALPNKFIPAKELTIADIEKQLGYKIKIVGEEK